MTHQKYGHEMSPNQDCIRDCNRDFPKCESDCDLNQFLILGRTDFPTYEANGITDEIVEFKKFQYHHHEVDMERVRTVDVLYDRFAIIAAIVLQPSPIVILTDRLRPFRTQNKPVLLNFKISSGFLVDFITRIVFPL